MHAFHTCCLHACTVEKGSNASPLLNLASSESSPSLLFCLPELSFLKFPRALRVHLYFSIPLQPSSPHISQVNAKLWHGSIQALNLLLVRNIHVIFIELLQEIARFLSSWGLVDLHRSQVRRRNTTRSFRVQRIFRLQHTVSSWQT